VGPDLRRRIVPLDTRFRGHDKLGFASGLQLRLTLDGFASLAMTGASKERKMSVALKTWFITGASSGFGRAFAAHALERGYNVVATARHVAKLEDLAKQAPERLLTVEFDVDRSGAAETALAAAIARFGRIDVVINNAGYGIVGAFEETP
jgi:NADPH:quinone reductase-like Zn-dependent oxidoreductase